MTRFYLQHNPDGTKTRVEYKYAPPVLRSFTRHEHDEYREIKKRMKGGEIVSREDFLKVKTIDAISNGRKRNQRLKGVRDNVLHDQNTVRSQTRRVFFK